MTTNTLEDLSKGAQSPYPKPSIEEAENELDVWDNRTRRLMLTNKKDVAFPVTIRRCGISSIGKLAEAEADGDDARMVQICMCDASLRDMDPDKFLGWLEDLEEDSQFLLLEKVEEVNGPNLDRHRQRVAKRRKAQMDASGLDLEELVKVITEKELAKSETPQSQGNGSEASPSPEFSAASPAPAQA